MDKEDYARLEALLLLSIRQLAHALKRNADSDLPESLRQQSLVQLEDVARNLTRCRPQGTMQLVVDEDWEASTLEDCPTCGHRRTTT